MQAITYQLFSKQLIVTVNNVKSVDFRSPTLNDVFLKYTGRHIMAQQEDHAEGGFMERYAQYENK